MGTRAPIDEPRKINIIHKGQEINYQLMYNSQVLLIRLGLICMYQAKISPDTCTRKKND